MSNAAFSVQVTPHCERLIKKLNKQHHDFINHYEKAIHVLGSDPYNRRAAIKLRSLRVFPQEKARGGFGSADGGSDTIFGSSRSS